VVLGTAVTKMILIKYLATLFLYGLTSVKYSCTIVKVVQTTIVRMEM
jgi:hypothetical protein